MTTCFFFFFNHSQLLFTVQEHVTVLESVSVRKSNVVEFVGLCSTFVCNLPSLHITASHSCNPVSLDQTPPPCAAAVQSLLWPTTERCGGSPGQPGEEPITLHRCQDKPHFRVCSSDLLHGHHVLHQGRAEMDIILFVFSALHERSQNSVRWNIRCASFSSPLGFLCCLQVNLCVPVASPPALWFGSGSVSESGPCLQSRLL